MNTFRRWVGSEAFHKYWPVFRSEVSPDFARFLEKELHLAAPRKLCRSISDVRPARFRDASIDLLAREFDREWPLGDAEGRTSAELIQPYKNADSRDGHRAWLLFLSPSGP